MRTSPVKPYELSKPFIKKARKSTRLIETQTFCFSSGVTKYLIIVECFKYGVHAVKFHRKKDKNSKKRFKIFYEQELHSNMTKLII